ncbi:MAG: hypothetical protein WBK28_02715 [Minisyncoccia bacterium]
MCKGSILVRAPLAVVPHTVYRVVNVADAPGRPGRVERIAALAPPGSYFRKRDAALSCVACFFTKTPISIHNVPRLIQENYDLPEQVSHAWLLPGSSDEKTDYVLIGDEKIDFALFIDEDVRMTALPAEMPAARRTKQNLAFEAA